MENFCVFCGERPRGKTKEHVIPKWLIDLTGDPNRKAFLGFDLIPDKPKMRIYAFNSFSFPACHHCNNEFSDLESRSQNVIISILENKKINDLDINSLLDWLDKVRVGLWLGFLILSKNLPGITPKFHIKTRICAADRLLFIYRLSSKHSGINFIGTESPSFLHIPSSFALRINNYCFFNVSHFNLCDRRLGFPYAREAHYKNLDLMIEADIVKGLERCFYPVVRKHSLPNSSRFFQPIFSQLKNHKDFEDLYDTDYVRNNSIDWKKGIGRVFRELDGKTVIFPRGKTHEWFPPDSYSMADLLPKINEQVYDFEIYVATKLASLDKLSKEERKFAQKNINFYRVVNSLVINFIKEQSKNIEL